MTRYTTIIGLVLLFIGFFLLFNPIGKPEDWGSKDVTFNQFDTWIDFDSPDGFKVRFPFQPEKAAETMIDQRTQEKRHYNMYVAETTTGKVFMVSIINFSDEVYRSTDQQLMRRMVMEILERKKDNVLEKIDVSSMQALPALDFRIKGSKTNVEGTVFMKGKRLFLLTEIAPAGENTEEFSYFRQSFRVEGE